MPLLLLQCSELWLMPMEGSFILSGKLRMAGSIGRVSDSEPIDLGPWGVTGQRKGKESARQLGDTYD